MFTVHMNKDGGRFNERTFDNYETAIAYAADLCGVTNRTMWKRVAARTWSGGMIEVSGRETGRTGVWVEES